MPVNPPVQLTIPPLHEEAVKIALPPEQIVELLRVTVGVNGLLLTVILTATLESLVQPFNTQTTRYALVFVGLTVILPPVSPSVHKRTPLVQAEEVSVTDVPEQIVVLLATTVGVDGLDSTETVNAVLESLEQPFSLHNALYDVVLVGLTLTVLPVKPPVQLTTPLQPVEVKTALVPKQTELLLLVIIGMDGLVLTKILTDELESLVQPFTLQRTL